MAIYQGCDMPMAGPDVLIGLDIDGTILHHKNLSISPRVKRAIAAHIDAGSHVIIATGRGLYGTFEALSTMGIDRCVAICSNGAIVVAVGDVEVPDTAWASDEFRGMGVRECNSYSFRVLDLHTFDPTRELEILHRALPQALVAVEELDGPRRISAPFPEGEITGPSVVVPLEELASPQATRVTLRAPDLDDCDLDSFMPSLGLTGVDYTVGWSAWFDVTAPGISKASGLARLASVFGTTRSVCAGDGGNDIEMIEWADIGAAMGQSRDSVKERADIVLPSVEDDGLAELLESMLS